MHQRRVPSAESLAAPCESDHEGLVQRPRRMHPKRKRRCPGTRDGAQACGRFAILTATAGSLRRRSRSSHTGRFCEQRGVPISLARCRCTASGLRSKSSSYSRGRWRLCWRSEAVISPGRDAPLKASAFGRRGGLLSAASSSSCSSVSEEIVAALGARALLAGAAAPTVGSVGRLRRRGSPLRC